MVNFEVSKFVDDSKLFNVVKNKADHEESYKGLVKLSEWVTNWQIKFNVGRYKLMHVGKSNLRYTNVTMVSIVAVTMQKSVLGSIVNSFLKTLVHCNSSYQKENRML